jgi:hypothetical protein
MAPANLQPYSSGPGSLERGRSERSYPAGSTRTEQHLTMAFHSSSHKTGFLAGLFLFQIRMV